MAEDDFRPSDYTDFDEDSSAGVQENTSEVELWQAHPKQAPATPYHALAAKIDRRRPENAPIRRWMSLADQLLNGEPEQQASPRSRKITPFPKNSRG